MLVGKSVGWDVWQSEGPIGARVLDKIIHYVQTLAPTWEHKEWHCKNTKKGMRRKIKQMLLIQDPQMDFRNFGKLKKNPWSRNKIKKILGTLF